MIDRPKPPAGLSKNSAAYFKKFIDEYEVDDSAIEVLSRSNGLMTARITLVATCA